MPTFVIMSTQFFIIRQKDHLKKLKRINQKQIKQKFHQSRKKFTSVWKAYFATNQSITHLCENIKKSSDAWTAPFSAYFAGLISLQCYLMYILLFIPGLPFFSQFIFGYGFLVLLLSQFLLISQCAKVAKNGKQIESANLAFYMNLLCQQKFKLPRSKLLLKVKILYFV